MKRTPLFVCAATALLLSACGDSSVKETLGIDQRAPDEFRVVSRPPLSVPPQFDLRAPGIGERDTDSQTRDKAQSIVLSGDKKKTTTDSKSSADQLFLQKAGAGAADPTIKQQLTEQKIQQQLDKEEKNWWDGVSINPENKEPIVKAEEEKERIKKNKEGGKPVTEGDVPETSSGPISTLEHWFGIE